MFSTLCLLFNSYRGDENLEPGKYNVSWSKLTSPFVLLTLSQPSSNIVNGLAQALSPANPMEKTHHKLIETYSQVPPN